MNMICKKKWQAALYCRLSREDGDRPESDSIGNQRKLLEEYTQNHSDFLMIACYVDDGYTGTNFDRPAFKQMLRDIEQGKVNCILVKDLSRFGRDYIDTGRYLERWLPDHGVRFVAVTDHIDSNGGPYDMMMPLKNLFNEQYARDISQKVKSALQTKQLRGEFIGAFASYGYLKDDQNHHRLLIDPVAARVVQRIFNLFESGVGKVKIAKMLNEEKVPCPSSYKHLMGERYHNGNKLESTAYWTYATVHRILKNEMYIGNMEQGRDERIRLHGSAKRKAKQDWVIVEGTHDAIISKEQWNRVQSLLSKNAKPVLFSETVSPFAGYLKCGDCGRAMVKTSWGDRTFYTCGSYKRYGSKICSKHYLPKEDLEQIVLSDLNRIIAKVNQLEKLADRGVREMKRESFLHQDTERLEAALARAVRMEQAVYEDYREQLISKEEFIRYREDYIKQKEALTIQLEQISQTSEKEITKKDGWVENLVNNKRIAALDRATVAETIKEIRVYENYTVEISYLFSKELGEMIEQDAPLKNN